MTLRIGGVPEHFNLPWRDAVAAAQDRGVDIEWIDFPGGTGAMAKAIEAGEVDLALMLTEGSVAAIGNGLDARIVATYVGSPLLWGIHSACDSHIVEPDDFRGRTYAISRFGSGSELMALVDARIRRWPTDELQFEVIRNFEGAREALANGDADVFFWERFMTKPTVDRGEFRLVDVRPTPWPSFMAVASHELLRDGTAELHNLLGRVREAADALIAEPEATAQRIHDTFGIELVDAREWMSTIQWTARPVVDKKAIEDVASHLIHAGRLDPSFVPEDVVAEDIAASWGPTMYDWRAEALRNALQANGVAEGPLSVEAMVGLGEIDHYHYLGTTACDAIVELLDLAEGDSLLDAGAGVGGPARYFAHKTGCDVHAVELREEWTELGRHLTERCGLSELVTHERGDIVELSARDQFDHVVSMLVLLHLSERAPAIRTFRRALKPGGNLVVEDFVARRELTAPERAALETIISAPRILSRNTYLREIEAAGFEIEDEWDLTAEWAEWTRRRADDYRARYRQEHDLHGASVVDDRLTLYGAAADLFASGAVGGVRVHARKPADAQ